MAGSSEGAKKYLSISEVSMILGVSIKTLRRWDKSGTIKSVRLDGKNRYFKAEEVLVLKQNKPLTISEAAQKLGLSVSSMRRLDKAGLIKGERNVRGERIFTKEEIERFTEARKNKKNYGIREEVDMGLNKAPEIKKVLKPSNVVAQFIAHQGGINATTTKPEDKSTGSRVVARDDKQGAWDDNGSVWDHNRWGKFGRLGKTSENWGNWGKSPYKHLPLFFLILAVITTSLISVNVYKALAERNFSLVSQHPSGVRSATQRVSSYDRQFSIPSVLGSTVSAIKGFLNINVSTNFNEAVKMAKNLEVTGTSNFIGDITAPNVIYSIKKGNGIGVAGDQDLTISNTGVLSLQSKTGDLTLSSGTGISISGLTITNSDLGSSQKIFKTINVDGTTFDAGSNTDTLKFVTGQEMTLTTDTSNKKITIAGNTGFTDDGTVVRLTTAGNSVGIGTTNPSSFKLQTAGHVGPNTNNTYDLGSTSLMWRYLYVDQVIGATSGTQGYWQRASNAISATNITDDLLMGATATSSALIKLTGTSGNNSWVNTGNLGIGTTVPGSALQVNGGAAIGYSAATTAPTSGLAVSGNVGIGITNPATFLNIKGNWVANQGVIKLETLDTTSITGITFHSSSSTVYKGAVYYDNSSNIMALRNYGTGSGGSLVINQDGGNVGIATTAPSYKLDIATSVANDRGINIANTGTTGTEYGLYSAVTGAATTNIGGYFTASGAGANYAAIFNAGNVGIGTTVPGFKLDITGGNASTADLHITKPAAHSDDRAYIKLLNPDTAGWRLGISQSHFFISGSDTADGKFILTSTGRLGIGTATPSYKVDIATSTASDRGINIANTAATGTNYGVYSSVTGAATANIGGYFNATGATTSRGLEVAAMTSATSTGLTIGALSGTTADTGINIGAISGTGATGTGITVGNISTTGTTNYGIQLGTMTGGSTSNYQINTGALTAVASATNAQLNLGTISGTAASSTNYGINIGAMTSTGTVNYGLYVGAVSGATSNYSAIFAGGNVGIGTTAPVAKLAVAGGLVLGSGIVNTAAPTNGLAVQGKTILGILASDTFTRSDGAMGNAETGQTWSNGANVTISSNQATTSNDSNTAINVGQTDVVVEADIYDTVYNNNSPGIIIRSISNGNSYLIAYLYNGAVKLEKVITGANTTVATTAMTLTNSQTYKLKAVTSGNNIDVYVDGVLKISYTLTAGSEQDNLNTASNTYVGLQGSLYGTSSSTRWDNFLVMGSTSLASEATVDNIFLNLNPGVISLSGTTQITSLMETAAINGATLMDASAITVDKATALSLMAPIEGANVTLSNTSALRILNTSGTPTTNSGIWIENQTAGATNDYGLYIEDADTYSIFADAGIARFDEDVYLAASSGNVGISTTAPSYKVDIATSAANDRGINIANTGISTTQQYGIYSAVTGAGTTNVGGYYAATGASVNYGLQVAALTGATNYGLDIGALSGATANYGINIGAISGAGTAAALTTGTISGTGATAYQLNLGAISGANATSHTGVNVGNISGTTANAYGINLGTLTGGTTGNYQISTGALTAVASATNAQLNLGTISGTAASSTNYGINIGAMTSTGTVNYGLYVGAVSGATSNYSAIFAGGNVGIGTTAPGTKLTVSGGGITLDDGQALNLGNNAAISRGSIATMAGSTGQLFIGTNNENNSNGPYINLYNGSASSGKGNLDFITGHYAAGSMYGDINFYTGAGGPNLAMTIQDTFNVGIGTDTSPDYLLELYDATNTPAFALSDDDIAHGVTDVANTDIFFHLSSISTTDGGAYLQGIADNVVGATALQLRGIQASDPTDTVPAIKLIAAKASGTGVVDLGAAETVFQVANNDDTAAISVVGSGAVTLNTSLTITGTEGSTVSTITAGDMAISDGSLAITDDDNAASFSLTNNTANTIGAGAAGGVSTIASTSLTTGTLLDLQLTEGTLNGGYYLRAWDTTAPAAVFSVGEDGNTTIAGAEGSTMFTLTAGDAAISDGSLSITDDDDAASFSLTNNTATTIGAGINTAGLMDISSTSLTTGNLVNLETTTALSSGRMLNITSTSTALTSGNLLRLDWTPGSATTATGDLFSLNIGANGTTTGNLFNILDSSSSIFSISETAVTTSLPTNFTSSGDVSIAYDINFTNPTASYIKSAAPLYIQAGETFNSSDLTLKTYNQGSIVLAQDNTVASGATSYGVQISSSLIDNAVNPTTHYSLYNVPTVNITGDTLTSMYGSYIGFTNTAGTTTNWYGQYIAAPTGSGTTSNKYAFVTEGGAGNIGISTTAPSYKVDIATSAANDRGINIANTGISTTQQYGIYSAVTGAGTTNVGGYYAATGASVNYGLQVAALTGATNYGLDIGALSGATANYGINIGAISGAGTAAALTTGTISGTGATAYQLNLGAISGANATSHTGINLGAISGTTANAYGINLSTLTGGTTGNYQINTGALTAVASATNAQLNLGTISGTAASSTNYGINIGAMTSTGTVNYGLYVGAVSGATSNYSAIFAGGNVGIGTTAPRSLLDLGDADLGDGAAGRVLTVGRNTNGTNTGAGSINFLGKAGTAGYVWQDATGVMRINTAAPTNALDTAGTVIGAQTSSLDAKNVAGQFTDYSGALSTILNTNLYNFNYKSGSFNNQEFTGIITDYSPTFGMDRDADHPGGKSLNLITGFGYMIGAIKELNSNIATSSAAIADIDSRLRGNDNIIASQSALLADMAFDSNGDLTKTGNMNVTGKLTTGNIKSTVLSLRANNYERSNPDTTLTDLTGIAAVATLPRNDGSEGTMLVASASAGVALMGNTYLGNLETSTSGNKLCYETVTVNGVSIHKVTTCDGTPADLAEYYPYAEGASAEATAPEAGDVIAIADPIQSGSAKAFLVKKADRAYDNKVIGVVTTKAYEIMGKDVFEWNDVNTPVALVGRVPVKITSTSKEIRPGDFITSSDEPGKAQKAEQDGYILGKALESWTPCTSSVIPDLIGNPENTGSRIGVRDDNGRIQGCGKATILVYLNQSVNLDRMFADSSVILEGAQRPIGSQGDSIATPSATLQNDNEGVASDSASLASNTSAVLDIDLLKTRVNLLEQMMGVSDASTSGILASVATGSATLSFDQAVARGEVLDSAALLSNNNMSESLSSLTVSGNTNVNDLGVTGSIISGLLTINGMSSLPASTDSVLPQSSSTESVLGASISTLSGPLRLQVNSLGPVEIMDGRVKIDTNGNITAKSIAAEEFKGVAGKSVGSSKISAGSNTVEISSPLVKSSSKILITATTDTNIVLSVTAKYDGEKFVVTASTNVNKDIPFDWFLINEAN